jgi:hypothetical protein
MKDNLRIQIATDVDRDEIFVELYGDSEQWGQISEEAASGRLYITVYPPEQRGTYQFPLEELIQLLERGSERMRRVD